MIELKLIVVVASTLRNSFGALFGYTFSIGGSVSANELFSLSEENKLKSQNWTGAAQTWQGCKFENLM